MYKMFFYYQEFGDNHAQKKCNEQAIGWQQHQATATQDCPPNPPKNTHFCTLRFIILGKPYLVTIAKGNDLVLTVVFLQPTKK